MRKIFATQFASLDGFMDEPGTWTFPFWNDQIASFKAAEIERADAMILGRTTYDGFAAVWPNVPDDEGGREFNAMPKYVASRTRSEFEWTASRPLLSSPDDDLVRAVTALKASDGPDGGDLMVVGSSSVFNALLGAGLIDELRLLVYPVVLRGSLPLFTVPQRTDLSLTASQAFESVLALTYVPATN
jgi:dihydrofolate reductase